jgi:hypothetical protein
VFNTQYPETLLHGLVIGMTGSHPSSLSSPSFLPSASSPGVGVSNSFFFISGAFSLVVCVSPFFSQTKSCLSALYSLSKHVMSSSFIWPTGPHLAASTTVSLEW